MKNAIRLSTGSGSIDSGQASLDAALEPFWRSIIARVLSGQTDTVVLDGPLGSGKSTSARVFDKLLQKAGIPHFMVGMDDDVMQRKERNGTSLFDPRFHPGRIVSEALSMKQSGGGFLGFNAYSNATGEHSEPRRIHVPGEGVALAEGIRSMDVVREIMAKRTTDARARVLYVLLDAPEEVAEKRRWNRDVGVKGLPPEEADRRIKTQRYDVRHQYRRIAREMSPYIESTVRL